MQHTFVSWDCCFRNHHHLVRALAEQDYPKNEIELIFVEQRTRTRSNAYNHDSGLPSLEDTIVEYSNRISARAEYLGDADAVPYHWGRCLNAGIERARGEYVTIMDGDILVRPDFVRALTECHERFSTTVNLVRRMATRPVGVDFAGWTHARIDFDECLRECPDAGLRIPTRVGNKGPCISAPADWWRAIGRYDEHPVFATAIARCGQDVTARLEVLTGRPSIALPGQIAVHPWHPTPLRRGSGLSMTILEIQERLIQWSVRHGEPHHDARKAVTARAYQRNRRWFDMNSAGGSPNAFEDLRLRLRGRALLYRRLARERFLRRRSIDWLPLDRLNSSTREPRSA